jgi:hypothetical protein
MLRLEKVTRLDVRSILVTRHFAIVVLARDALICNYIVTLITFEFILEGNITLVFVKFKVDSVNCTEYGIYKVNFFALLARVIYIIQNLS